MKNPHKKPLQEIFRELKTSEKGLSHHEAQQKLTEYGPNTLPEKQKSRIKMFVLQFNSPLIFILFGAVMISLLVPYLEAGSIRKEDLVDPAAIFTILLLNALFGFFQEMKAENTLKALKQMQPDETTVMRDGKKELVTGASIVPGDILIIGEGDRVSADARLLEAVELRVIESALTGESSSVEKSVQWTGDGGIGDRKNMLFSGSEVASGRAVAVVVATALETELGKIATLVAETESPKTPLEKRLDRLGKKIGLFVLAMCLLVFVLGILHGNSMTEALFTAVALAVAAVPEGLPAVMTISLAVGVAVMAKKNALIRELRAVETLGSVTVIASDKTGTITKNRMKAVTVYCNGKLYDENRLKEFAATANGEKMLDVAASCNDAELPGLGDPTEIALLEVADRFRHKKRNRIGEMPFSSEKKWMSTTHAIGGRTIEYIKGAPEMIEQFCRPGARKEIQQATVEMAADGLRTIAVAIKEKKQKTADFLGIFGLLDPPRKTAESAIRKAKNAGIRTVMITGDHGITAAAIAKKVGLEGEAIVGDNLEKMTDAELQQVVKQVQVFARVTPEHKVRICAALQANGEIVAMTGDGVNDAPAIHRAEVGISMGKVGTSVARQASDMVLLDDRFATIVKGIEEGRRIFSNIKKSVSFLLRTNFSEVILILLAVIMGVQMPLAPIHILFLNLLTDSFPALAMAAEPAEKNIMKRSPRPVTEGFLSGQAKYIFAVGLCGALVALGAFLFALPKLGLVQAQSLTLATIVCIELLIVFSIRRDSPLLRERPGLSPNPWVFRSVVLGLAIFALVLFTPLRAVMDLQVFPAEYWSIPLLGAGMVFLVSEGLKYGGVRRQHGHSLG